MLYRRKESLWSRLSIVNVSIVKLQAFFPFLLDAGLDRRLFKKLWTRFELFLKSKCSNYVTQDTFPPRGIAVLRPAYNYK